MCEAIVEVGDQMDQASGLGSGTHSASHHLKNAAVDLLELLNRFGRLHLLGQVKRAAGLLAEQVDGIDNADQFLIFINYGQVMNVVFGHLKDGLKNISLVTNRRYANMHDVAHFVFRKNFVCGGDQVAQVTH